MIVAITGHRPNRVKNMSAVQASIKQALKILQAEEVVQGLAAGADLWSGLAALELGIPVVSVKPWAGHAPSSADKALYELVESRSHEVIVVNESTNFPGNYVYHERNHAMVDRSDTVLAIWDGQPTGGTYATVKYAQSLGRRILRINPDTGAISALIDG